MGSRAIAVGELDQGVWGLESCQSAVISVAQSGAERNEPKSVHILCHREPCGMGALRCSCFDQQVRSTLCLKST